MAEASSNEPRISVLVAGIDPVAAEQLRALLDRMGYRMIGPAADGIAARALAGNNPPDIALIDLQLPGRESGVALGKSLVERGLPVVFVSAGRDAGLLARAAEIKPYGLLLKPVDEFQLGVTLEGALRQKAEERLARQFQELSESERRFRAVFEQAGVGVSRQTPEGCYLEVNERFALLVGRRVEDLLGRCFAEITHPEDMQADAAALERLLGGHDDAMIREKRYLRPDGSVVWCRVNTTVVRDPQGQPECLLAVAEDISARRVAEAELKKQLAFQQSLMDAAVNPIYVQDPEGHYISINTAYAAFLGVTIESALGLTAGEIFSDEVGSTLAAHDREILEQGGVQHFDIDLEDASGRLRHLVFHRARFDDAEGRPQGIVGVATDMTDSKQVEMALRNEQDILRRILTGIRAGIFVIDPKTRWIEDVNPVAEAMCGRNREEMLGKPCGIISWHDADGRPITTCALTTRNIVNEEMRLRRPEGRTVPVIKTVITAMRDGVPKLFEIVFDISERKTLERQLAVAQKLESIGELAAGIAHEINTPTQYIGDNLHFLSSSFEALVGALDRVKGVALRLAEASDDETALGDIEAIYREADVAFIMDEAPRALEQSVEGVARVTAIVSAMKKFSHPGGEEKTAVDINAAVENTVTVAKNEWKYVADVELELDRDLPSVFCLPGDFNQVILNILVNAAHAIGSRVKGTTEKGTSTIRTATDGDCCLLTIRDTGSGIPEEHRTKIFDPFFTTKEVGKGTGQGLAITHNIVVSKHGGSIDFETEIGKGTTFFVRIPFDGRSGGQCHAGSAL